MGGSSLAVILSRLTCPRRGSKATGRYPEPEDQVEPVRTLRENLLPYLSGSEFAVIPDSGHLIPLDAPAGLAAAIASFGPAASFEV